MKDSDKKLLLGLAAVAIIVVAYLYVISPTKTKIDTLNGEIATLQSKYNDLKAKEAKRDVYEKEIKEFNEEFTKELVDYPADLNQETTVMFLKGVESQIEFIHKSIQMGQPSTFYILGQGATTSDAQVIVDESQAEESYICQKAEFPIQFKGTYEGVKNYLNYIAEYKFRSNISTMNVQYDPVTSICTGSVTLDTYSVSGPERNPETVETGVPTGVPNIFTGGEGSNLSNVDKYAATQGSEIAATHNLIMLLNSAANDTTSGIIIASNEGDEATFVTSSDNAVADVVLSVYSSDGKNFVDYSIGGSKYTTEILTSDLTVYVKATNRVDGADVNGVNVSVQNTTGIPVYFKVAGDDTTSPRFNIGSKTGTVKVY